MSGAAIAVDRKWRRSTAGKLIAIAPAFVRGASGRAAGAPGSDSIGRCESSRSWSRSSRRCRSRPSAAQAPRRDLAADERCGGHTLARHVGKTNRELAERLRQQPDISAASTYPDLSDRREPSSARRSPRERSRIATWSARRGPRPNLALRYTSPGPKADRPLVAARQGRARRLLSGRRRAALGRLARRVLRADVVSRGRTMSVSKKTPRAAARSTRARVTQPVARRRGAPAVPGHRGVLRRLPEPGRARHLRQPARPPPTRSSPTPAPARSGSCARSGRPSVPPCRAARRPIAWPAFNTPSRPAGPLRASARWPRSSRA